jgi:ABC-type transport system involved in multi-copper enzyme maturation permease subunit
MNRGLMRRAWCEVWPGTLILGLLLLLVEAVVAFVLAKFGAQFSREWLGIEFARNLMQAMLGTKIMDHIGPAMFQTVAWVHPVVLALAWAHALICGTRVPAGEIDRGTADVLLGLPVSRREVFFSESFVWLASGALLLAAALTGNMLGSLALPEVERPAFGRLLIVLLNFYCLYFMVGGLAWLISSCSDRRGRAMTTTFLILLVLFLLSYLVQFWQPLEKIVFLSPLQYHRPVSVLDYGTWPAGDMGVLLAAGLVLWGAAGWIFCRRDLCTV